MPSYHKFQHFPLDLVNGIHDFDAHVFKVMLTNAAPDPANHVKADLTEISPSGGYAAGGPAVTITTSEAAGVASVTASDVLINALGGSIGPWRYAALYNDTASGKPLIGWWDYGSSVTVSGTDDLTITFTTGIIQVS